MMLRIYILPFFKKKCSRMEVFIFLLSLASDCYAASVEFVQDNERKALGLCVVSL